MSKKRHGQCNICGEFGPLTLDHVPPKGVAYTSQMRLYDIVSRVGSVRDEDAGLIDSRHIRPLFKSPDGIKFPTLCGRCNNEVLGANNDLALIEFANAVSDFYSQPAPPMIQHTHNVYRQPHKIMRSVIGHLCALAKDRYRKGPLTEAIRDYLLDDTLPLPEPLEVYYWVYPERNQVLIRDCAYMHFRLSEPFSMWVMKFRPLAFMVTWDVIPENASFQVNRMSAWRGYGATDSRVPIPINVFQRIHPLWPECPNDDSIVLYGSGAFVASPDGESPRSVFNV